jgi:hypothetical protein
MKKNNVETTLIYRLLGDSMSTKILNNISITNNTDNSSTQKLHQSIISLVMQLLTSCTTSFDIIILWAYTYYYLKYLSDIIPHGVCYYYFPLTYLLSKNNNFI